MSLIKKTLLLLVTILGAFVLFAQEKQVEMADQMRSSGRIYVVIAVILTILIGLLLYLVRLDRKISKLEKDN
ncbi:MAG TPA: CcmD family protein [Chitinophagaceae bacterium]|jgi:hypothetical protein|nr:CcmD family protein [Chitinophagaceae bacterium]